MNPTLGPLGINAARNATTRLAVDRKPTVGLLAVQGDFAMHRLMVESLGYDCLEVRTVKDLHRVNCMIMPGGESTTMRKILKTEGLFGAIREYGRDHAIMGTCAGLILLGRGIINGKEWEDTLGLIDIDSDRNAYGSQFHSFRDTGKTTMNAASHDLEMVFIRAPRIVRVGAGVEILAQLDGESTMVREGHILALTFHPEMGEDQSVHRYFIEQIAAPAMQRK